MSHNRPPHFQTEPPHFPRTHRPFSQSPFYGPISNQKFRNFTTGINNTFRSNSYQGTFDAKFSSNTEHFPHQANLQPPSNSPLCFNPNVPPPPLNNPIDRKDIAPTHDLTVNLLQSFPNMHSQAPHLMIPETLNSSQNFNHNMPFQMPVEGFAPPAFPFQPNFQNVPPAAPMASAMPVFQATQAASDSYESYAEIESIEKKTVSEEEKNLDYFLQRFQKGAEDKRKQGLTVVKFRSLLKNAFSFLSKLSACKTSMEKSTNCDSDDVWNCYLSQTNDLKNEICRICDIIVHPANLSMMQKKLMRIKRKRKSLKKLRKEAQERKQEKEVAISIRHRDIDKNLDNIKEKHLKEKREVEMKKDADYILAEVHRKIHEAKRTLEKLKVFEKLRAARKENSVKKGLFVNPESDAAFNDRIAGLREQMLLQLADYEAEERALKVMLETEQEGQLEEEANHRTNRLKAICQKRHTDIMEGLFGDSVEPELGDPLYLFYQYQNSAQNSVESLLHIRRMWDDYISEDGDPIPEEWIVPASATNESFSLYVAKEM